MNATQTEAATVVHGIALVNIVASNRLASRNETIAYVKATIAAKEYARMMQDRADMLARLAS
jgi:hypothetical protein